MGKSEILKTFLEMGYQLDSRSLELFSNNPKLYQNFIEKIKNKTFPSYITIDLIEKTINEGQEIRIKNEKKTEKKIFGIQQIVKIFNQRYEKICRILQSRLELVNVISINRVSEKTSLFSLIGIVKEVNKNNNSITIEDVTGETEIFMQDKENMRFVVEDEVVGVICENISGLVGKKIVFPDTSANRNVIFSKNESIVVFINGFSVSFKTQLKNWFANRPGKKFYIFIFSADNIDQDILNEIFPTNSVKILISDKKEENVFDYLSVPAKIIIDDLKISFANSNILNKYGKLFCETDPASVLLQLLKKRHLDPIFSNTEIQDEDNLFLEDIPDILVSDHEYGSIANYKGTTLVSIGSFLNGEMISINLKNREAIKVVLA